MCWRWLSSSVPGLFPQQQGLGEVHWAGDESSKWCTPLLEVAGTAAVEMAAEAAGRREEEEVEEAWLAEAEVEDLLCSRRAVRGADV